MCNPAGKELLDTTSAGKLLVINVNAAAGQLASSAPPAEFGKAVALTDAKCANKGLQPVRVTNPKEPATTKQPATGSKGPSKNFALQKPVSTAQSASANQGSTRLLLSIHLVNVCPVSVPSSCLPDDVSVIESSLRETAEHCSRGGPVGTGFHL